MVEIAGVVGWDDLDNFFVKEWGQPFCPMVVTGVASSLGSDSENLFEPRRISTHSASPSLPPCFGAESTSRWKRLNYCTTSL